MISEYVNLLVWIAVAIAASWALDKLWARSVARWAYVAFATPGIIVHELSHWAACILTGAKVSKVTLISREGGSVTHGQPRGGIFGQAVISMAPFVGIPLTIILLGFIFEKALGCEINWDMDISGSLGSIIVGALSATFDLIKVNLVDKGAYWFLLYTYLAASLTVGLAPSAKDFRNGMIGLVIVLLMVLVWIIAMEKVFPKWDFVILGPIVDMMGWVVVVGLITALMGSLLALPFLLIRLMTK